MKKVTSGSGSESPTLQINPRQPQNLGKNKFLLALVVTAEERTGPKLAKGKVLLLDKEDVTRREHGKIIVTPGSINSELRIRIQFRLRILTIHKRFW
jgi:hypothetical protein